MFRATYRTQYGTTVPSDDPKLDAYKYAALMQAQGRHYSTHFYPDGHITVSVDGCEPLTFELVEELAAT